MFADEPSMLDCLLRMTRRITPNFALRQDLLQEALIHLWLTETRRPGQTKSWYLQSCKFHLRHYLASGRSVDSTKRGRGHTDSEGNPGEGEALGELPDPGHSLLSLVSALDLVSVLSSHLSTRENAVLNCLADGLGPREIGRKLEMSHSMAIKHRSKIASLVAKLEGSPLKVYVRAPASKCAAPTASNDRHYPHHGGEAGNSIQVRRLRSAHAVRVAQG